MLGIELKAPEIKEQAREGVECVLHPSLLKIRPIKGGKGKRKKVLCDRVECVARLLFAQKISRAIGNVPLSINGEWLTSDPLAPISSSLAAIIGRAS